MAIVDDYAGIAAALRRLQAERSRPLDEAPKHSQPVATLVTARGALKIEIRPQLRGGRILPRRGWTTD